MPPDRAHVTELIRSARRIAVVGLSPNPSRPSHSVAAYLQRAGYIIVPVHPAGGVTLGERVYPDLRSAAVTGSIDIVDIFRRSEYVPALVDDIVAVHPKLVWLQVGVRHDETAEPLEAAGIDVVMDRCLAVDHGFLDP